MATVYRHLRNDTGSPFYVGIGKTTKRAYSKYARNDHWHKLVNKAGYSVDIIYEGISWEEACKVEQYLIGLYGRKDLGKGGLVNMTDGGEGISGLKHTTETKAKQSAASLGKPKSEETKAKMSDTRKGKKASEKTIEKLRAAATGRTLSEETKAKLRKPKSEEGKANMRKPKPPRTAEHCANISAAKKAWWAERKQNPLIFI